MGASRKPARPNESPVTIDAAVLLAPGAISWAAAPVTGRIPWRRAFPIMYSATERVPLVRAAGTRKNGERAMVISMTFRRPNRSAIGPPSMGEKAPTPGSDEERKEKPYALYGRVPADADHPYREYYSESFSEGTEESHGGGCSSGIFCLEGGDITDDKESTCRDRDQGSQGQQGPKPENLCQKNGIKRTEGRTEDPSNGKNSQVERQFPRVANVAHASMP